MPSKETTYDELSPEEQAGADADTTPDAHQPAGGRRPPIKLGPGHEAFCQYRAQGMSLVKAYGKVRDSGNYFGFSQPDHNAGSAARKICKRQSVMNRIAYWTERYRISKLPGYKQASGQDDIDNFEADEVNVHFIRRSLFQNMLDAKSAGKYADANRALELMGRTIGMFEPNGLSKKPVPKGKDLLSFTPDENQNVDPPTTLNLQIINQFAKRLDDQDRTQPEARDITPVGRRDDLDGPVSDGGPAATVEGPEASTGENPEGVLRTPSG